MSYATNLSISTTCISFKSVSTLQERRARARVRQADGARIARIRARVCGESVTAWPARATVPRDTRASRVSLVSRRLCLRICFFYLSRHSDEITSFLKTLCSLCFIICLNLSNNVLYINSSCMKNKYSECPLHRFTFALSDKATLIKT